MYRRIPGGGKDWVIQSVFGRAQYNYAERYLAEVTMRYDGSSRFPSDSVMHFSLQELLAAYFGRKLHEGK